MRIHSPTIERYGFTLAIKVGQALREARAASGLSLHRLADKTEIGMQFLDAIESGTAVVTIQAIETIAEAVDWHWERIFLARTHCTCCGGEKEPPHVQTRS